LKASRFYRDFLLMDVFTVAACIAVQNIAPIVADSPVRPCGGGFAPDYERIAGPLLGLGQPLRSGKTPVIQKKNTVMFGGKHHGNGGTVQ
jgi:hypothetical protein